MAKLVDYRIVIAENPRATEVRSALFLREKIKVICGKKLDVVKDTEEPCKNEIVIGQTNREKLDAIDFNRSLDGRWEYVIKKVNDRVYITGLGAFIDTFKKAEKYFNTYANMNDGGNGTAIATYHFIEEVLGYKIMNSAFSDFEEKPDLEMPNEYSYAFTREVLRAKMPKKLDGASMHFINVSERLDWNMMGVIIKTKSNKIIVIDGGHEEETDRFIKILCEITGEEVPTVDGWLFSHLHSDHFGVYCKMCEQEKYRGKVNIKNVYCNFLGEDYNKTKLDLGTPISVFADEILNSDKTLGAKINIVKEGDILSFDDINFEVLHVPNPAYQKDMNINDTSVVYKMTCEEGQSVMFLGDAECVCDKDLIENKAEKLKSDIVQVGHHGCGSVSPLCYKMIGAWASIWTIGERFWYGDSGDGINTYTPGVERYRIWLNEVGIKKENTYINMDEVLSFSLPIKKN